MVRLAKSFSDLEKKALFPRSLLHTNMHSKSRLDESSCRLEVISYHSFLYADDMLRLFRSRHTGPQKSPGAGLVTFELFSMI